MDFADGLETTDESLKSFLKTWDKTGNIQEEYQKSLAESSSATSNFGKTLMNVGANMAIMAAATLLIKGIEMAVDYLHVTLEEANDALTEANSTYETAQNELKSLQSEFETTSERMADLQELADDNTITLAEEAELETLRLQNAELERKIALKEKEVELEGEKAAGASDNVLDLNRSVEDITQQIGGNVQSKTHTEITPIYKRTDILTATKNELNDLKDVKNEREKLLADYTDDDEEELAKLEEESSRLESAISENLETLTNVRNGYLDTEGNLKKGLSAKQLKNYREVTKLLDEWAYIDLTPTQRDLKMLESYFDGSVSKNAIKERFMDAIESGDDLDDVMKELGLSLDDIGVDSIENLERYFRELKEATDSAKDSVMDYSATVSDVEKAFESENKDNDWSTISEKYKSSKELLKEGKTGTDDFKTMTEFLNPALVQEYMSDDRKYSAESYEKAFKAARKTADRWFSENETKSMQNFVNDFKGKGLFDVKTDDMGYWDITTKFNTTAEAAKEFGMSVQSVETMLRSLEAYGYGESFAELTFSGDALEEYQSYLQEIQEVVDSTEDEELKLQLKAVLEEESEKDYATDIEDLTAAKIQEIKVIADISQYDSEISKLKAIQENDGFSDTGANAEILGTYEVRNEHRYDSFSSKKKKTLSKDKGYNNLESTEDSLTKKIKGADSQEERAEFQRQKLAVEEFKASFLDEFNDSGISWSDFLKTNEAQDTLDEVVDTYGVSKDEIENIFDSEIKAAPIHIEVNKDEVEKTLENAAAGSTVTFTAEIDDQGKRAIEALKDEKGNITYTANIDGVEKKLLPHINPITNEVTYIVTGDKDTKDKSKDVEDSIEDVPEEHDVTFGAKLSDGFDTTINNALQKLNSYKNRARRIVGSVSINPTGGGQMHGSAYSSGTLGISSSIPYNVLNDDKYRTGDGHVALTGELGPEIVVHGSSWYTVGDNGAEFAYIPSNSVIFNHEQTKRLLSNGSINSRGKARMHGSAHLSGTAHMLTGKTDSSGKNNSKGTSKNNNNNKNNKSTSDAEDFDWIERMIKKIERAIENFGRTVDATYKTWTTRNNALTKELSSVRNEIKIQDKASDRYMKEANSVGLDKKYKKLVQDGKIDISSIKNEKLKDKITEYQNWCIYMPM